MSTAARTAVSADGLRFTARKPGSAFAPPAYNGAPSVSCLRCSKHRPRNHMKTFKLAGKSHLVCAPTCKELSAQLG